MYIQLTTRCNMTCGHCCFACTAKGVDMTMRVYRAAMKHAEQSGSYLSLGGGEPTVHPRFWEILIDALGSEVEYVWLATNGKKTETAIKLARMARRGIIGCRLSLTQYHGEIDQRVIDAFTEKREYHETNDLRGSTGYMDPEHTIKSGRYTDTGSGLCCCDGDAFVRPDGEVYQCGCSDSLHIGNVFDGFESQGPHGEWVCSKDVEQLVQVAVA